MKFVIGFFVLFAVGASSAQSRQRSKAVYENLSVSNVTQLPASNQAVVQLPATVSDPNKKK